MRDGTGAALAGSLSERVFVGIKGVRQGMFIQSADISNPVLMFLHGGPGMPQFFLTDTHPTDLAQHFTGVWLEQRGAGLSFDAAISAESMTIEQMVADAVAVADYLRDRFGQDRIYLLGLRGAASWAFRSRPRHPTGSTPTSAWRRSLISFAPR